LFKIDENKEGKKEKAKVVSGLSSNTKLVYPVI